MERLKAYTNSIPDGGIMVDIEGMAVDLLTVMKAGGYDKGKALQEISEIWDELKVKINIPDDVKN